MDELDRKLAKQKAEEEARRQAEEAKQILQDHLCKLMDEEGDLFRQYPEYFAVLQS